MTAGLATPLHLAASLLALSAAVGLAVLGFGGIKSRRPGALLVAAGGLALAVGHTMSGALIDGSAELAAWLRGGGLLLLGLGLRAELLPGSGGLALLVPVPTLPPAVFAAAGGLLALLRLVPRRGTAALFGVGAGFWGAAELAMNSSVTAAAALHVAGAVLVGSALWFGSARSLVARVSTAFVTLLMALVVLVATVLSGQASDRLVDEELTRLADLSARLADDIGSRWPRDAIAAARPLRTSAAPLLALSADDRDQLAEINDLSFRQQDFFALLGPDGVLISAYSDDPELLSGSFTLALSGAAAVDRILNDGRDEDGGLITVSGRLVALGAVKLAAAEARAEEAPLGVLVTGRIVDEVWVAQTAETQRAGFVVEVADVVDVASANLPVRGDGANEAVLHGTAQGGGKAVLHQNGQAAYAAASPIRDPNSNALMGRLAAVRAADVIAAVEREQVRSLFLLALLGGLAAALMGAAITGRLVGPIRRLTSAAEKVRAGELDTKTQLDTPDELGRLGRTFDAMTSSLATQSAELVEAAEVQSRLRARLEAMTASMGDALVAVDANGEIITFNPAAERLTGRRAADVNGSTLDRALRLAAPEGAASDVLGDALSAEQVQTQVFVRGRGGRPVPAAVTASPVRDGDGAVLGRVLVLRDMTREAEVDRMKAEFLANVSHELRTPLTPIKGYAEILARRDVQSDKAKQYAQQILESTTLLERIVGMIVDFAGLDSGQVQLNRQPVKLSELVSDTLVSWRSRHPKRRFTRRVAKTLPPVMADADMLRRALNELLDNAIKFSPGGEPISISAVLEEDRRARFVRLTVRDRGVGIDEETAANVFTDFYQVDGGETRQFGGLGLGLALVRRIVDGIGGSAEIESVVDEGTEVHLLLPVAEDTRRRPRV